MVFYVNLLAADKQLSSARGVSEYFGPVTHRPPEIHLRPQPREWKVLEPMRFAYVSPNSSSQWTRTFLNCGNYTDFDTCGGYMKSMAQFIAERLNTTIQMQAASADSFSSLLPNGSWTPGVTRDVIIGKADFSIGGTNSARCSSTVCLDNMYESRYAALLPAPGPKSVFTAFVQPFSFGAWAWLFALFLVTGLFMSKFKSTSGEDFTWMGFLAATIGQNWRMDSTTGYGDVGQGWRRIFLPMWTWLVGMRFMTLIYSALIMRGFLNPYQKKIDSLEALLATDMNVTVTSSVLNLIVFIQASESPVLKQLEARMTILNTTPPDFYPGDNEAYIDDKLALDSRIDKMRADGDDRWKKSYVFVEKKLFPPRFFVPFFNKDFPRLADASKASREFAMAGMNIYSNRRYLKESAERVSASYSSLKAQDNSLKTIKFSSVYSWFLGLLLGNSIATIVFIAEILGPHYCRRKLNTLEGSVSRRPSTRRADEEATEMGDNVDVIEHNNVEILHKLSGKDELQDFDDLILASMNNDSP